MTKSFSVSLKDSLDDNIKNNGIYQEGQFTQGGTLASDDLAVYQVSPVKHLLKDMRLKL